MIAISRMTHTVNVLVFLRIFFNAVLPIVSLLNNNNEPNDLIKNPINTLGGFSDNQLYHHPPI